MGVGVGEGVGVVVGEGVGVGAAVEVGVGVGEGVGVGVAVEVGAGEGVGVGKGVVVAVGVATGVAAMGVGAGLALPPPVQPARTSPRTAIAAIRSGMPIVPMARTLQDAAPNAGRPAREASMAARYPRGSARPRVAMMLRWISLVPPPIVEETACR